ncbi:hypothetical protein CRYUN_Cryun30bG0022900 [Craigia yunnanensis]
MLLHSPLGFVRNSLSISFSLFFLLLSVVCCHAQQDQRIGLKSKKGSPRNSYWPQSMLLDKAFARPIFCSCIRNQLFKQGFRGSSKALEICR